MFCFKTRSIFYWISAIGDYIGAVFQLLFVIFFVCQHFKRNSDYSSPYYSMLTIGYMVAFIYELSAFFYDSFDCYSPIYLYIMSIIEWYFLFLLGFWNFSVGLYRCTALAFPFKHDKIWNKIKYYMILLIIIFPFMIHGHSFLNFHCKTHTYLDGCEFEHYSYMFEVVMLNSFLSILTLLLVCFAILKARSYTTHLTNNNAKIERRLIIQTIFSSIFQIFYYFFFTFHIFCRSTFCDYGTSTSDTLVGASLVFYAFQHYSSVIILVIVSPKMRNNFFKFYKLGLFFNKSGNTTTVFAVKTITNVSSF